MSYETLSPAKREMIDHTIAFLNELVAIDPEALALLIETRVPCNQALADHPSVQVQSRGGGEPGWRFCVGFLGVLNGILGADDNGWGFVCVVLDDDKRVVKIKRTPPGVSKP